jgi:2-C-methyl-D-erythritol 2,4-cyclodiphosphate synthase
VTVAEPGSATRVGLGIDLHRWDPDAELWLGGVRFAGEPGLAGYSDGDVVCHAIADAILGAAALGDLGQHFPEDDPAVAGIAGAAVLRAVVASAAERGFSPAGCDVTVICERPSIGPRRDEMRARISDATGIPIDGVSVKATRPEGLGLVGDGVGAIAVVIGA